jgi:hypothetical protein
MAASPPGLVSGFQDPIDRRLVGTLAKAPEGALGWHVFCFKLCAVSVLSRQAGLGVGLNPRLPRG